MHEWKKSEKLQSFEQFMGYLRPFLLRPCVVVTQKCIALEFEIRLLLSFRHKTSKKVSKKKLLCTKLSVSLFEESKFVRRGGARCLKITEKVSFNIASEASYIYILSG